MNPKTHIGDGKFPNHYWVFHCDEKFTRNEDDELIVNTIEETKSILLGEFKNYQDAIKCVNEDAYLPHIVIEDRITGMIFEMMVIVCPCCGKEEYETREDIEYTKYFTEQRGLTFK